MFFGRKKPPSPPPAAPSTGTGGNTAGPPKPERRGTPRIETTVLTCALGEVSDVSRTGVRVCGSGNCKVKPGESFAIELCSPTESVEVSAKVVRTRSSGYGRFEMGLQFERLDERTADKIENLARYGSTRVTNATAEKAEQLRRLSAALKLPDHYAALGLSPSATMDQIQQAFRALARKYHPDLNPSPEAEKLFCAINEANHVLSDPERRAAYDALAGHSRAA